MNKRFTKLIAALALLVFMTPSLAGWGQTRSIINWTASEQGYSNQQEISSVTFDDNVSAEFNKGDNSNAQNTTLLVLLLDAMEVTILPLVLLAKT